MVEELRDIINQSHIDMRLNRERVEAIKRKESSVRLCTKCRKLCHIDETIYRRRYKHSKKRRYYCFECARKLFGKYNMINEDF